MFLRYISSGAESAHSSVRLDSSFPLRDHGGQAGRLDEDTLVVVRRVQHVLESLLVVPWLARVVCQPVPGQGRIRRCPEVAGADVAEAIDVQREAVGCGVG